MQILHQPLTAADEELDDLDHDTSVRDVEKSTVIPV